MIVPMSGTGPDDRARVSGSVSELQRVTAERDAALGELDRLRSIPELRVGQRLRHTLRRLRRVSTPAATRGDTTSDSPATTGVSTTVDASFASNDHLHDGARHRDGAPRADSSVVSPDDPHAWLRQQPAWKDDSFRTVAVQVVLFQNTIDEQRRLAAAIAATVRVARNQLGIQRVVLRYGDSSTHPCLTDDDVAALRSIVEGSVDEVSFTFFDANLGSAGGSNALAALGDEDVVWVLNPDTHPSPAALAELLSTISGAGVAAADGRQIPIEHPKDYDPATGSTSWASGCSMVVRRKAFDEVSGFDAHFFPMYCDDVDMSWRLRIAGWTVAHAPRAVLVHDKPIGGGGVLGWNEDVARWSHLARLWLCRRYGRPDLEASVVARLDVPADPVGQDAVREFRRRVADGDVPEVIPDAERAATFVGSQYARHRFGYSA
jgi:GT2 family glycosyltransferase